MCLPIDCKIKPHQPNYIPETKTTDHCMISVFSILFITAFAAADTSSAKSLQIERSRHAYI